MGKAYAKQVIKGKRTIDTVPVLWIRETIEAFYAFVEDGTITPEEFEKYTGEPYEA